MTETVRDSCDHGVVFDEKEARGLLGSWQPRTPAEWVVGNPNYALVRMRFPRLFGRCPKGCGFEGISYASMLHYLMGNW